MQVQYDAKADLIYIRLDERKQKVINRRISNEVVLDMGKNRKIIGLEILNASKCLNMKSLFPLKIEIRPETLKKVRA
jgi:uncharacterized protein YuzE